MDETDQDPKRPASRRPGRMIGDYRVVREIGRGGMGVVYEAEQQHPRRSVALKVIRGAAYVDSRHIRLFQREAQTLARLRHPDIAGIYEAGRTDDGEHFFAMELVPGQTLDRFLAGRRGPGPLDPEELRERLGLFARISQAVSYAHQRGVIHRDLKPANILVAPRSGTASGQPGPDIKILDFGLARITHPDVDATEVTEIGNIRGTLPYMSPEQVSGNSDDVDVRSDVYALGVILYEVLTGKAPYELPSSSPFEAARVICEVPPSPLARNWGGGRRPDGDLETIVGKALEKEPARRYQSAAALAEDVTRYLNDQPILARPPSAAYHLKKLFARHKLRFAFALTLLLFLVAFGASQAMQARRLAAERDRANQEAETAQQVVDFLVRLFSVPDPHEFPGDALTAREILDHGAETIRSRLDGQPAVQARLLNVMGSVYANLGLNEEAYDLAEASYRILRALHPAGHRDVAEALLLLATAQHDRGKYDDAERLSREALAMQRPLLGERAPEVATSLQQLARTLKVQGRLDEAEEAYREALSIRREELGRHTRTASTLTSLGELLRTREDLDGSEALHREALDMARALHGELHPQVTGCLNNLALVLQARGDVVGAERLMREVIDQDRRLYGERSAHEARALNNLAALLRDVGRLDEAEALHREALAIRRQVLGNRHAEVASSLNNLAVVLQDLGRDAESVPYMREAIQVVRQTMGDDHPRLGVSLYNLGKTCYETGDHAGAARAFGEALPILERSLSPRHWRVGRVHSVLGDCLVQTKRLDEAEGHLMLGLEILIAAGGENHPETQRAAERLEAYLELPRGDLQQGLQPRTR